MDPLPIINRNGWRAPVSLNIGGDAVSTNYIRSDADAHTQLRSQVWRERVAGDRPVDCTWPPAAHEYVGRVTESNRFWQI